MKKSFVLIILILMVVLISTAFADGGWLNAESEIQKSVQGNSAKPSTVEFIDLAASMVSDQIIPNKSGLHTQLDCGCAENKPYAMVVFWSAKRVENILESRKTSEILALLNDAKDLLNGDFTKYFHNTNGRFSSYPQTMNLGIYDAKKIGVSEYPLIFLFISTNATMTISVRDDHGGYLINEHNEEIEANFGFASLTAKLKSLLQSRKINLRKKIKKVLLFTKPKIFSRSTSETTVENPLKKHKIELKSLWLKTKISESTHAGVYKDKITITVSVDIEGW